MKKLLLIAILGLLAFVTQAQPMATVNIPVGQSLGATAVDYTLTNAVVRYTLVTAPQNYATMQDVSIELDSLSGNHTNVAVALFGQKFDNSAWVAIGSAVNWKGTTADTTILISNETANRYRNYKIQYTGTGTGTTKVDVQQLKQWYQ